MTSEVNLKFFKTHRDANIPEFATTNSACFDLAYSSAGKNHYEGYNEHNKKFTRPMNNQGGISIMPRDRVLVPTGLILDIPEGYSVRIHPRSGISLKFGINLANCEGVIDSDYFYELFVMLNNITNNGYNISNGDRIAQGELVQSLEYDLVETQVKPIQKTNRVGGLGSTGISVNTENVIHLDQVAFKRPRGRPKIIKLGT